MIHSHTHIALTRVQHAVYACLCYYDIFQFPLNCNEILNLISIPSNLELVQEALDDLTKLKLVSQFNGYYAMQADVEKNLLLRFENENRFQKFKDKVVRAGQWISRFPFVRAVAISGSCAKGVFPVDGDADFFIITAPNRLWIARTILIAYKKIFLLNSKKFFCVNYFIDENNLHIPDENIFVAHEIIHLKPIANGPLHQRFLDQNQWVYNFWPNAKGGESTLTQSASNFKPLSKGIEFCLSGKLGDWLENYFFKYTLQVWQRKFADFNIEDFDLNLRSRRNVSKHHPRGFQKKVLEALSQKLSHVRKVEV